MLLRLHEAGTPVSVSIDGRKVQARAGESVATALLAAGVSTFRRTAKSGAPRSAYCGMGVCFECLVTIDGDPNQQSCLVPITEGMVIVTGQAAPDLVAEERP